VLVEAALARAAAGALRPMKGEGAVGGQMFPLDRAADAHAASAARAIAGRTLLLTRAFHDRG